MCWKWKYFNQFSFNQFNSSQFHFNRLNGGSIYRGVRSSVDVQMDIDRGAGEPEVRVALAQGLHQRGLQRPASRICVRRQHGRGLRLRDVRPVRGLVWHGLRDPDHNEYGHRCAHTHLLRPEEHLGARLSMGFDCILLHDIKRSHQCQWMVIAGTALLWNYLRLQFWMHRPDNHRR